jgi:electron transport complex protein RnfB
MTTLAERIDALLPQTQCTRCGYPACRPYAEAIAAGEADINQCPPGGAAGIIKLATLLGRPVKALNPANGIEEPLTVARVEEEHCIGCTLCIQACPTDAIIGAPTQMHTIVADWCTGCGLCLPPCPVDCIVLVPAPFEWDDDHARQGRVRFVTRNQRLDDEARASLKQHEAEQKKAVIAAAMARARAQHQTTSKP